MKTIGFFLVLIGVLTCTGCSNRTDANAFMNHYVNLHRAGDVQGLLSLHTADAEFVLSGKDTLRGLKELGDLFEADAVFQSRLTMAGIHAKGDTIFIDSITEKNKWFEAFGVKEVHYGPGTRIVLRNGLIKGTYPGPFDREIQERLRKRFQIFLGWVGENHPDVMQQLMPGGKFLHNAASARLWLKILSEWQASQQSNKSKS